MDGPAADVYAAGAVLYQVVTGEVPFNINDIDLSQIHVPDEVLERSRERYQLTKAMLKVHTDRVGTAVQPCCMHLLAPHQGLAWYSQAQ